MKQAKQFGLFVFFCISILCLATDMMVSITTGSVVWHMVSSNSLFSMDELRMAFSMTARAICFFCSPEACIVFCMAGMSCVTRSTIFSGVTSQELKMSYRRSTSELMFMCYEQLFFFIFFRQTKKNNISPKDLLGILGILSVYGKNQTIPTYL